MVSLLVITDRSASNMAQTYSPILSKLLEKRNGQVDQIYVADKSDPRNASFFSGDRHSPHQNLFVREIDRTPPRHNPDDLPSSKPMEVKRIDAAWFCLDDPNPDFTRHAKRTLARAFLLDDPEGKSHIHSGKIQPVLQSVMGEYLAPVDQGIRRDWTRSVKTDWTISNHHFIFTPNDLLTGFKLSSNGLTPLEPNTREQGIISRAQSIMKGKDAFLFCGIATKEENDGKRYLSGLNIMDADGFIGASLLAKKDGADMAANAIDAQIEKNRAHILYLKQQRNPQSTLNAHYTL